MINRMNTDTLVLLVIFQNTSYYIWMITWMQNVKNFPIAKVQHQCVAYKKEKRVFLMNLKLS